MNFNSFMGDSLAALYSGVVRGTDGSWIAIQTDRPSYYAGDVVTGAIIAQINSPRSCSKVLLKVAVKERVLWDEEIVRTFTEGEGESKRTVTRYEHASRGDKLAHRKDVVVVSALPHTLLPGAYRYPFTYALAGDLPGTAHFRRETEAADPAWRSVGRRNHAAADVAYKLSALFEANGAFQRDLRCKQEIVVNPRFDWSKMAPASGSEAGQVRLCCCIPRGPLTLSCTFDKAAYAAGETARVNALVNNESESNATALVIKLMRFITLTAANGSKSITDVVAQANYPGVDAHSSRSQEMPLTLSNAAGGLLPGTTGRRVKISYRFDVAAVLSCASDIAVHLPIVIYTPPPTAWGLAGLNLAMPQALAGAAPAPQLMGAPSPSAPAYGAAPSPGGGYGAPSPGGAGAYGAPGFGPGPPPAGGAPPVNPLVHAMSAATLAGGGGSGGATPTPGALLSPSQSTYSVASTGASAPPPAGGAGAGAGAMGAALPPAYSYAPQAPAGGGGPVAYAPQAPATGGVVEWSPPQPGAYGAPGLGPGPPTRI